MVAGADDIERLFAAALADPDATLRALDKVDAEKRLRDFARVMWPIIEPGHPLIWGWALDAMCELLEAVHRGDVKRALFNVPPGFSKSTLISVLFPAWEWGPRNRAELRYLCVSYVQALSIRDNRRCRMLIESDLYQSLWGDRVTLTSDQNAKVLFENDRKGWKAAAGITGNVMGHRADRICLDDPNDTKRVDSDAALDSTTQFISEVMPSRFADDESATMIMQQRTGERDASGHVIEHDLGYTKLILPMKFVMSRRCFMALGFDAAGKPITFEDPRTDEGELLFPARFSEAKVEEMIKDLSSWGGDFAVAGQLQQDPIPRGGGMFKRAWFQIWTGPLPAGKIVRGWDLAGSTGNRSPFSVGALMRLATTGQVIVEDVDRARIDAAGLEDHVAAVAARDREQYGDQVEISLPQDPGQAGKAQKAGFARALQGYRLHFSTESGAKDIRAAPFASQGSAGNLYIVAGKWNKPYIAELSTFPRGLYADQVDASSRAYARLIEKRIAPPSAAPMIFGMG